MTELKFGVSGDRARFYGDLEFRKRGGTHIVDTQEGRTANLWENQVYTSPSNIILPNGNNVILNYNKFPPGSYSRNPADYIPYDPITTIRPSGKRNEPCFRIVSRSRMSAASATPNTI